MTSSHLPFNLADPGLLTLERLKGLSDGVVSIVLTLLVLGIDVPEHHDFSKDGLLSFLSKCEYDLTVYAVSFVLIGGYWIQHNVMFHYFKNATRGLLWFNLLFLFLLTLIPFTTQLLGTYENEPLVVAIYGVVNMACGCSLAFMWWGANRLAPVVWPRIDPYVVNSMLRRIMLGPGVSLVAVGVAVAGVRHAHLVFLSIPFLQLSHRIVDRHWIDLQAADANTTA